MAAKPLTAAAEPCPPGRAAPCRPAGRPCELERLVERRRRRSPGPTAGTSSVPPTRGRAEEQAGDHGDARTRDARREGDGLGDADAAGRPASAGRRYGASERACVSATHMTSAKANMRRQMR